MRVWTIQATEVLRVLQAGTVWRAQESFVDPQMRAPFRWMAEELSRRVEPPSQRGQVPVWVWCQWRGELRRSLAALRIALHQVLAVGRHLQNNDVFERNARDPQARARLVPFGLMLALGVVFVLLAACIVRS